jgi:hypothetical protein
MGLFEDILEGIIDALDVLAEDDDSDDWDYSEYRKNSTYGGRHRFVVNYISQNGTPCGVEVLAYTHGQARDSVQCRSDVKYVTSCYEI